MLNQAAGPGRPPNRDENRLSNGWLCVRMGMDAVGVDYLTVLDDGLELAVAILRLELLRSGKKDFIDDNVMAYW